MNRVELTQKIIQKAGLPKNKKTAGYLTLYQMQCLLLWIDKIETDCELLNKLLLELKESMFNKYGSQHKSPKPESIQTTRIHCPG